jgi:hypothetical protein
VIEAAVEPHRRVERADLLHEHERQLGLERVRVLERGEIAALLLAGVADGVGEPVHDLAHARLVAGRAGHARLAEILADHDVRGELRPLRGHLDAVHGEHRRAIRIGDDGLAALPLHVLERMTSRVREAPCDVDPCERRCVGGGSGGLLRGHEC